MTLLEGAARSGPATAEAGALALQPPARLGPQVRTGLVWSLANSVSSRALTLISGVIMARLLSPGDYGIFAVALVTLTILQSMNELGVSMAIVCWRGDVSGPAGTAVTLAAATSVLFYAACFVAAPSVATALGAPPATGVIRVLALAIILDGLSTIPVALMNRAFLQGRRAIADIAGIVVSSTVSLFLAANGHGATSLAWGMLTGIAVASGLVLVLAPARPRPAWDPAVARELIRFGMPLAATSLLSLAILNVDFIVVGRELGPTQLGFYLLAFNLSSWPSNILSVAIRRVAVPGFARLVGDEAALSHSVVRGIALLTAIGGLCALTLGFLAQSLIPLVYGERWLPAATALRFLTVLCAVRIIASLCYDVLVAIGRGRALLAVQVAWFVTLVPALVIGTRVDGIRGAAIAHALVAVLVVLPAYLMVFHRRGPSLAGLPGLLARPALAGAGVVAAVAAGRRLQLHPFGVVVVVAAVLALAGAPPALRGWRSRQERRVSTERVEAPEEPAVGESSVIPEDPRTTAVGHTGGGG